MIRRIIILLLIVGCESVYIPNDCKGYAGGIAELDNCGVCDGNNSPNTGTCDCAGTPNGVSNEDNCGTCDSDNTNDCQVYDFFIVSDKDIHGMQFDITGVTVLGFEPVSGFEIKYDEISENHYRALIISMQGLALPAHLTIIFSGLIENLCIKDIILADSQGNVVDLNDICD